MSKETTDNFWAVWDKPVEPAVAPFYRLYYDDLGNFLFYSMEAISGNYIEIDHATFTAANPQVKVVNGQLKFFQHTITTTKLIPSTAGQACDPRDITVIVNHENKKYWKLKALDETN